MKCAECQRELSACLDGEVTGAVRAQMEAHVAGCADCRQRLTDLRQIAAGVKALPQLPAPPQFMAEVRRKIWANERRPWFDVVVRPVWLKVPLEAVALVVVLGTVLVLVNPPRRDTTETAGGRGSVRAHFRRGGEGPPPSESKARNEAVPEELAKDLSAAAPAPAAAPTPVIISMPQAGGGQPLEPAQPRRAELLKVAKGTWDYKSPVEETITVEDADAAAVQEQAAQVAVALKGRMLPVSPQSASDRREKKTDPVGNDRALAEQAVAAGQALRSAPVAQNFQVELPRRNVVAFKSQLMQVTNQRQQNALMRQRKVTTDAVAGKDGQDVAEAQRLDRPESNAVLQAAGAKAADKVDAEQKKDGAAATTVLEIQVVPPKK